MAKRGNNCLHLRIEPEKRPFWWLRNYIWRCCDCGVSFKSHPIHLRLDAAGKLDEAGRG